MNTGRSRLQNLQSLLRSSLVERQGSANSHTAKSRAEYQDSLTIRKDADPDIPIVGFPAHLKRSRPFLGPAESNCKPTPLCHDSKPPCSHFPTKPYLSLTSN